MQEENESTFVKVLQQQKIDFIFYSASISLVVRSANFHSGNRNENRTKFQFDWNIDEKKLGFEFNVENVV